MSAESKLLRFIFDVTWLEYWAQISRQFCLVARCHWYPKPTTTTWDCQQQIDVRGWIGVASKERFGFPVEVPQRMGRLCLRAVVEGAISHPKAAELLKIISSSPRCRLPIGEIKCQLALWGAEGYFPGLAGTWPMQAFRQLDAESLQAPSARRRWAARAPRMTYFQRAGARKLFAPGA